MGKPVGESMLRLKGVAQVPFTGMTTGPAVFGQDVSVADLLVKKRMGVRTKITSAGNEIVDPVLGGNTTGQERGSAGGADRDGGEEILEPHTGLCQAVDVGGADLRVAIAACGPDALVVGENEYNVGFIR